MGKQSTMSERRQFWHDAGDPRFSTGSPVSSTPPSSGTSRSATLAGPATVRPMLRRRQSVEYRERVVDPIYQLAMDEREADRRRREQRLELREVRPRAALASVSLRWCAPGSAQPKPRSRCRSQIERERPRHPSESRVHTPSAARRRSDSSDDRPDVEASWRRSSACRRAVWNVSSSFRASSTTAPIRRADPECGRAASWC
jgi:hypothetical protein